MTLDRTELDADWWVAFARAGFTPGSRSDPRTTRGWLEWQRNQQILQRRQEREDADELRRRFDEQAEEDAEVRRLQQAEADEALRQQQLAEAARVLRHLQQLEAAEVLRVQQEAEAAEVHRFLQAADVLRQRQQAQAAAEEHAAQAVIDAEIAETLRLAEELFRAEAAEAVLCAQRLAEEEAKLHEQRERQRLADEVEFEAYTASWADEQRVLSQLDADREESASAIELATKETALEQQAEEETLMFHSTRKGKNPAVAGAVSNNSCSVSNGGRGISGIVAANGPVSVSYGVGEISAVCVLPASARARLTCVTQQAESSRKRPASGDLDRDVSPHTPFPSPVRALLTCCDSQPAPGTTIWVRLRDTNDVVLVPAYETLATTIARFMENVDPVVASACAGIMGAGKPPSWIAMTRAQWLTKWDDEVWAVVKSWGGRQRGTVEVEVEAVWGWE